MTNWIRLAKLFHIKKEKQTIFPVLFLTTLTLFGLGIILPTYKDYGGVKVATPNLTNSSMTMMKPGRDILQAKIHFKSTKSFDDASSFPSHDVIII